MNSLRTVPMILAAIVGVCARADAGVPAPDAGGAPPAGSGIVPPVRAMDPLATRGPVEKIDSPALADIEGPLWLGSTLIFSDYGGDGNKTHDRIWRYDPQAAPGRRFVDHGYPGNALGGGAKTNGLALAPDGSIVVCERNKGRVMRWHGERLEVLASSFEGKNFHAPNDAIVRADGNVYFTDPKWGAATAEPRVPFHGVYRITPKGTVELVDRERPSPNGVALSPDGRVLYVGDDSRSQIHRYQVEADGHTGPATLFIDGAKVEGGLQVPDGIAIDDLGNLYVTSNSAAVSAVVVFAPDGHQLGRIAVPRPPSNATFGDGDRKTLYITAGDVYRVRLGVAGLP